MLSRPLVFQEVSWKQRQLKSLAFQFKRGETAIGETGFKTSVDIWNALNEDFMPATDLIIGYKRQLDSMNCEICHIALPGLSGSIKKPPMSDSFYVNYRGYF